MVVTPEKRVEYLVVDTTAFIQNAALQEVGKTVITVQEVVDEIVNKRQLRRLCVLPYDLVVKDVFPENIYVITEFSKKTGDYPALSATDIKVMALTYQLEKEHVGIDHLKIEPIVRQVNITTKRTPVNMNSADVTGFYLPGTNVKKIRTTSTSSESSTQAQQQLQSSVDQTDEELKAKFETLNFEESGHDVEDVLVVVKDEDSNETVSEEESEDDETESDGEDSWITPSNVHIAKKQVNSELIEDKYAKVACMTTDFAMQNVLKQMNLNVSALDGRIIKQLRTFILRCYSCFKTTSVMTKVFCPKCGNNTLKRVAFSLDENGKQQIHINARRPLTGRGKRFSMPTIKGGKHSNNPVLTEDQPRPDQKPSRLAKTKNNPMAEDYIAGYSPFVTRDVNSKSAQLCIRPGQEVKYWMRKNPNEARRGRRK